MNAPVLLVTGGFLLEPFERIRALASFRGSGPETDNLEEIDGNRRHCSAAFAEARFSNIPTGLPSFQLRKAFGLTLKLHSRS